MKKIIIILFLLITSLINLLSQDELIWEKSFPAIKPIYKAIISKDGNYIAFGGGQNIKVLNKDGKLINTLDGHENIITSILFSDDGKYIFSGAGSEENIDYLPFILKWDLEKGIMDEVFEPDSSENLYLVESISLSSDGKYLAGLFKSKQKTANENDRKLQIWDLKTGSIIKIINYPGDQISETIKFSPDNNKLLVSKGRTIEVLNVPDFINSEIIGVFEDWHINPVSGFSISSDSKFVATVGDDGFLKLWRLNPNSLLLSVKLINENTKLTNIEFGLKDQYLIVSDSNNKSLTIYDLHNNVSDFTYSFFDSHPLSTGISGDKQKILVSDSSKIYLLNAVYKNPSNIYDFQKVNETLSVFPNPCNDYIILNHEYTGESLSFANQITNIQIFNTLNQKVLEWENLSELKDHSNENQTKLSLEGLAEGCYYIALSGKHYKIIKKFIKINN